MCKVQVPTRDSISRNSLRQGSILKNPDDAAMSSSEHSSVTVPLRSQSVSGKFPMDISPSGEMRQSASANNKKSYSERRSLSFSTVDIREYQVTLGDHPDCSNGPPVTLDWKFDQKNIVTLEDYEVERAPQRRSTQSGLALSYYQRKVILLEDAGHSKKELKAATLKKANDYAKRERTKALIPFMRFEEAIENARRKKKDGVSRTNLDTGSTKENEDRRRHRGCLPFF